MDTLEKVGPRRFSLASDPTVQLWLDPVEQEEQKIDETNQEIGRNMKNTHLYSLHCVGDVPAVITEAVVFDFAITDLLATSLRFCRSQFPALGDSLAAKRVTKDDDDDDDDDDRFVLDCGFYLWLREREDMHVDVSRLSRWLGAAVKEARWLKNPAGQWYVNKVYLVQRQGVEDKIAEQQQPEGDHSVCVKVQHPWWNGTGKHTQEVRSLCMLSGHLPCPAVLRWSSLLPPTRGYTLDALNGAQRCAWRARQRVATEYEWFSMRHIGGDNLGDLWSSLTWAQRRPCIVSVVRHLCKIKSIRFDHLGVFAEDGSWRVQPGRHLDQPNFCNGKTVTNFRQYVELQTDGDPHLMDIVQDEQYDSVPIVMCLGDVAPKNILVDASDPAVIVAFLDFEWAGPQFLGSDYAEMDYECAANDAPNESFTDCPLVPYSVQREFVGQQWEAYGFNVALMRRVGEIRSYADRYKQAKRDGTLKEFSFSNE